MRGLCLVFIGMSLHPEPVLQRDTFGGRGGTAISVHFVVDRRNLVNKALTVRMLKIQNVGQRPVKMVSNECYLLVQLIEGVA